MRTFGMRRSWLMAMGGMYCVASAWPVCSAARRVWLSGTTRQMTRSTCGAGFW